MQRLPPKPKFLPQRRLWTSWRKRTARLRYNIAVHHAPHQQNKQCQLIDVCPPLRIVYVMSTFRCSTQPIRLAAKFWVAVASCLRFSKLSLRKRWENLGRCPRYDNRSSLRVLCDVLFLFRGLFMKTCRWMLRALVKQFLPSTSYKKGIEMFREALNHGYYDSKTAGVGALL